jgi:chaperone required for assembly of F1-ATPase
MTAIDYIKTLNLAIIKPVNERHAVDLLILSHQSQRKIIQEQQKTLNSIPNWVKKFFARSTTGRKL